MIGTVSFTIDLCLGGTYVTDAVLSLGVVMLTPQPIPNVRSGDSRGHAAVWIALIAFALTGCGGKPSGPPPGGPPSVGVITIQAQPVTLEADLPGRTSPYAVSDVRPQISGLIQARLFTEGSDVRAGQLLYRIDPAPYQAAYDQADAQLANARATLFSAKLKADRYADMVKINAVSQQDADDAKAASDQAAAAVRQQTAALESARINLAYTRLTAPISGRIGASSFTQGALVTNGQASALATIQKLDPIYVDVAQTASELLALRDDMAKAPAKGGGAPTASVRLKLADGRDYPLEGRLQFTDVTVDQTTGSVTLRAIFPNPKGVLLPGMYVRARVTEGVDPAGILAPQQAVTRDEKGRPTALVVDAQDHAQARILQLGEAIGNQWRVRDGLKPGDRLIVVGGENAKPGEPVTTYAAPAAARSSAN
jgi:membrane fusion protein (multidrug efflux system)